MAKVNPDFQNEIYRFIHRPVRDVDKKDGNLFLERYIYAFQRQMENAFTKIDSLSDLYNPAKTPQPRYLKDIVGFTKELDSITNDISDADLRKLIGLAVSLWKEKGLEVGYKDIIRLFTGKNSRIFNWFDFRYIVGEQGLAQEELGEDSWFISQPGVEQSLQAGNVVLLLPFEGNFKDRSLNPIDGIIHGDHIFFNNGPVNGSEQYLHLFNDGIVEIPNSSKFNFSDSFTIEGWVETSVAQNKILFRKSDGTKVIQISYNSATNQITYLLYDGVTTITETLASGLNLDDGTLRHLVLMVDRDTNLAKLFFNGTEKTTGVALGALGDLTNIGKIWLGGSGPGLNLFEGSFDEWRVSLSAQYNITAASILVQANEFVQYQEEQLDEFFCDVRVVDEGDLNRTLTLRILNLMRPVSERLRVIYIRFFENFSFGKGGLTSVVSGSFIDTVETELVLPDNAVEIADVVGAPDFKDIALQIRGKIVSGSEWGARFLVQDANNYYLFKMRSDNSTFELFKVVGGVPTALASAVTAEIYNNTYYVLSIVTDFNESTSQTLIKCYQDRNEIFSVIDSTYEKGTWGVQSGMTSQVRIGEIEMFLMPLEFDIIEPNQVI